MNHCQFSHCNDDNCCQPVANPGMCNLYNPAHYSCTYQYSHTVLQAPTVINYQWSSAQYDAVYKPCTNETPPPEESLNTLLQEQNDKYMSFVNPNMPLSPMSMRSVDTFDTPLSPNLQSLYYAQNDDAYLQDYPQDLHHQHQQQMQLQMQFELEHMQSPSNFICEPMPNLYNQRYMNGYDYQANMSTTATTATEAPKRKRNSGKRTPESQLICPTCSRKFSRPYNLKSHQRTHTNERPYVCQHPGCRWTFARPHDLKRHDLLHSGIKKYICSCGKPFARSDAFKRHQAVDKVCSLRHNV